MLPILQVWNCSCKYNTHKFSWHSSNFCFVKKRDWSAVRNQRTVRLRSDKFSWRLRRAGFSFPVGNSF